uniref:Uncharacterized protein n=1 Tax=Tetranychus urticae TaxID=32264 RepID=T1L5G8_TETUR
MSTYTNNSRTRPRFRDRAKNQMNKFKSAVSSALPSVTSFGSSEFERHPRVWESLVTSGIVALFTLNVVFLYPLVYGGLRTFNQLKHLMLEEARILLKPFNLHSKSAQVT